MPFTAKPFSAMWTLPQTEPALVPVLIACYESALACNNQFPFPSVRFRCPTASPGALKRLVNLRIIEKGALTRGGSRRYYSFRDLCSAEREMQALRLLPDPDNTHA
jgi:hypothetical protein